MAEGLLGLGILPERAELIRRARGLFDLLPMASQGEPELLLSRMKDSNIYGRKAAGSGVTDAAIDKAIELVGDTNPVVKPLLKLTALKESKFGTDPNTFNFRVIPEGTVGHGGIMQMGDRSFRNIVNSDKKDIKNILSRLKTQGIDFKKAVDDGKIREFLEVPVNSVLAARLHYRMNNRPLPKVGEISKYYEDIYAPQTKK